MQVVWRPQSCPVPKLSVPTLASASLELKAEKQSAHSGDVNSVAFSPDGKTIVSGADDQTLKVWDAGASMPPCPSACQTDQPYQPSPTASLELKATKENAHNGWVMSVGYNSDGDKIVSGGEDGTLKVWDAGVKADTPAPISFKSDHFPACDRIPGA